MIRNIATNRNDKRYDKAPRIPTKRRKEPKEESIDRDYKLFRQTYQSYSGRPVSLSNFFMIKLIIWLLIVRSIEDVFLIFQCKSRRKGSANRSGIRWTEKPNICSDFVTEIKVLCSTQIKLKHFMNHSTVQDWSQLLQIVDHDVAFFYDSIIQNLQ